MLRLEVKDAASQQRFWLADRQHCPLRQQLLRNLVPVPNAANFSFRYTGTEPCGDNE